MALDTRIPLGVEQVDFANPLALLMQTRQNTQDRATAAQDRQREIARQSTQDQQRNTEFNQNSELNSAKIAEFKNSAATKQYLQDTLRVKNLLEANDERQAAMTVQAMQQRFKGTDYAKGLDEDFSNIVNGNLEPVLSGINSEIQAFQQMGQLSAPERVERQTVTSRPGERVVDAQTGEVIADGGADQMRELQIAALQRTANQAEVAPQTVAREQNAEMNIGRLEALSETAIDRAATIEKATEFLDAFKNQGARSGAERSAVSWLPTFTDQGRFDEAFNAFAEVAARQQLKASGETRPTDADVKGMKDSMFGVGRDEAVNMRLLEDFIRQQSAMESEYQQLRGAQQSGGLGAAMPSVSTAPSQLNPIIRGGGLTQPEEQPLTVNGFTIRRVN
jgi:hypothetical protein